MSTFSGHPRRRTLTTAGLSLLIAAPAMALVVGCGGDAKRDAGETAEVATPQLAVPEPTATDLNSNGKPDKDPSDQDWPGKMVVALGDADTPEATQGRTFMENTRLLDHLADDINNTLKLPFDVTLKGAQCGSPNDFWSPGDKTLTMCYEDATASIQTFEKLGYPDPQGATFNTEAGFFYHEVGHMVIDIYQLPATGRDEDIADEASAYLMLLQNDDGTVDPASIDSVKDVARLYEDAANGGGAVDDGALADVHSPDKARMYNFECWAYGADPARGADLVSSGMLPQGRADGCGDEYEKLERAWSTLLAPYLK